MIPKAHDINRLYKEINKSFFIKLRSNYPDVSSILGKIDTWMYLKFSKVLTNPREMP